MQATLFDFVDIGLYIQWPEIAHRGRSLLSSIVSENAKEQRRRTSLVMAAMKQPLLKLDGMYLRNLPDSGFSSSTSSSVRGRTGGETRYGNTTTRSLCWSVCLSVCLSICVTGCDVKPKSNLRDDRNQARIPETETELTRRSPRPRSVQTEISASGSKSRPQF